MTTKIAFTLGSFNVETLSPMLVEHVYQVSARVARVDKDSLLVEIRGDDHGDYMIAVRADLHRDNSIVYAEKDEIEIEYVEMFFDSDYLDAFFRVPHA